jgi:hypothetical protein
MDIFWASLLIGLLILFRKQLQEAIEEIGNRLGGPPGPMGPLPSTDAHLLLRRPHKEKVPL